MLAVPIICTLYCVLHVECWCHGTKWIWKVNTFETGIVSPENIFNKILAWKVVK